MGRSAGTLILFSFGVHGLKSMVTTWVEPLALDYLKYDGSQEHMCRSAELKILLLPLVLGCEQQ